MSACSEEAAPKKENNHVEEKQSVEASLKLEATDITVSEWKYDSSHLESVKGKITVDGKPVENAEVQISDKRTMNTDQNGEFKVLISRNTLAEHRIYVANADEAKIDGKVVDKQTKKSLLSLEQNIVVNYPIEIEKVEENKDDSNLVDVYGKAILAEDQEFPNFTVSKYRISGTLKDAAGNPIEGATVNFRRDGVEGFTMSNPSDKDGYYQMYYLPEDEENHYMNVLYKDVYYTLPDERAYLFPEDISINIDITLPEEGTFIKDEPPTLVSKTAKGALYVGTFIGVNIDENVKYTLTIPKTDGTFKLTLPKEEWDKNPTFFETKQYIFLEDPKHAGDLVDSDFISDLKETDPNEIVATQK